MLIRIRFIDTGIAIEEAIDKHDSDKEVNELLYLLVLSFFCLESDYEYNRINSKIQKKLKLLDIDECVLEDIYNTLYEETTRYLPQYLPHSNQHCVPLSCIQKTTDNTFTFRLGGLPIAPVLS